VTRRTSSIARTLDRYIGIPGVAALSILPKRKEPEWSRVQRIGVLKTAAIGDTLLLGSMLAALRTRFPSAEIILIAGGNNASAAELLGRAIDRHVVVSVRWPLSAIRVLRRLQLDVLLECGPWPRYDALITALSGAAFSVGFRVDGQARHFAFDRVVEHSRHVHQIENLQRLAASIGATAFGPPALTAPGILSPDRLPTAPFAVCHPFSGGYMGHVKEWPVDRWVELARRIQHEYGADVLISGGPDVIDQSRQLAAEMQGAGVRTSVVAGALTLGELADLLLRSFVVVSVNTGVMHLAALLGAATVSLEGPVPPSRWGPVGPRTRSVVTTLPGCGYLDLGFEYAGHRLDCMEGVSVGAVMDAVADLVRPQRSSLQLHDGGDCDE
jgi:heptosyltransferase-3